LLSIAVRRAGSSTYRVGIPHNRTLSAREALCGAGNAGGGFVLQLNITNFNNYSSEDITELTNEVMQTAGEFIKRKGGNFCVNYFEYNGVRSSDMGVRIMSKNVFSAPKYDLTFQSNTGP